VHLSQIETPGLLRQEESVKRIHDFADKNDAYWHGVTEELPTCSAMCVVFPKRIWEELGGFDEGFFLYGEDTDFFSRAAELGRIVWHRGVYVHHYGSQSVARAVAAGEFDYAAVRTAAQERYDRKHGR
jgi:GT2 family glycosyltransferase